MPILPPGLDDRRFDDLVEDLLARIPAHTPEWTNPRLGDPGRTLIELFAWLGDTLLYRANLIPERQRLAFLSLLGIGLEAGAGGDRHRQPRPTRSRPSGARSRCGPAHASTGPCRSRRWAKRRCCRSPARRTSSATLTDAEATQAGELIAGLARIHRHQRLGQGLPDHAGLRRRAGRAGRHRRVRGERRPRAVDRAARAPKRRGRTSSRPSTTTSLAALGGGDTGAPALISIGVVPALKIPEALEDVSAPSPVPVMWEITTQGRTAFETDYLTLDPLPGADGTNGLTRPGVLRLSLPDESLIWAPSNDVAENPAAGVGDTPPRIDDVGTAARLIAWLRLRPRAGQQVDRLPLTWIGINAVDIDQRDDAGRPRAGRVDRRGRSGVLAARRARSIPATLQVQVEEPGRGYQPWYRVDDLAAISGDARVAREAAAFELDAEAGTLRFGDGVRGRVPERQMRVRLASGRFGGGRAGNLPAGQPDRDRGACASTAAPRRR